MLNHIVEESLRAFPGSPVNPGSFQDQISCAREDVLELISRHLTEFGEQFPAETCVQGYYPLTENVEWTTSFWTGQLWLAWEMSGESKFREMAEKHVRSFGMRIAGRHDTNTHDLGFLYTLSCVAAWRLTGNRDARGFSLMAAEALLERFHEKAQIIQAWGDLRDPDQAGRMIIDCNMNLPLLY
ncbi:TPA: glycoside hydrolase family 88 protein, partial [Citrobacter freundii]|nr:glucuronyl hydrolase [Citrobacter freundii]HCR3788737.1 glycoside hydrolase family 88 protein [Citrobacter freundii]HCR3990612.1 glycoside hydrolase family 88 protein [Citrobacter freundii]